MKTICNGKINLYLKVIGKRDDGYHELETVMTEIDYGDTLELECADRDEFICNDDELTRDNLVSRAIELVRENYFIPPLKVKLYKRLPTASGMGGGSSDACATLKMLNSMFLLSMCEHEMLTMCRRLGMDVSFFVRGGIQRATGRGEVLEELDGFKRKLLIVYDKPSYSGNIYSELRHDDLLRESYNTLLAPALRASEELNGFYEELMSIDKNFKMTGAGGAFFLIGEEAYLREIKEKVVAEFKEIVEAKVNL